MEWSKLPVTVLGTNVWGIQDPDSECYTCCCCELSPGDSEVSSIFRASQRVHADGCEGCEGCCCGGGGGDVVYGVPTRAALHYHRRGHRRDGSSSDSEETCPCCLQQQQVEGRKYHSQPNVFTISHKDNCHVSEGPDNNGRKQCVSDSEGLTRKQACVLKKSKHPEKRKHRDHSGGRSAKKGNSPERGAEKHKDSGAESASRSDPESIIRSEDRNSNKHIPSKLQVKAIAEKSDDDSPTKSKPSIFSSSSEPIYENVSARIQENQNQNRDLKTTSDTTDGLSQNATEKTDSESSELQGKDLADKKLHENEDVESKPNKDKELKTKQSRKNEELRNKANKDSEVRNKVNKDKESATRRSAADRPQTKGQCSRPSRQGRQLTSGRQDPWYVCSESEDSALPPETFSSSIDDGFTATDVDSDGSLELII